MVSALAFGYGVGMAAPQSTIATMEAAVATYQGAPRTTAPIAVMAGAPAAAPLGAPALPQAQAIVLPGSESPLLGKLRDRAVRDAREGGACDLERPTYSRPPRYASTRDRAAEDVDELDVASTEALSRLQLPDLPLTITRRTLKYVRFFARTDRGRGMFETWLKRSGRYQELIQAELREWRLPEDLIWLAMIESGFDPRAKSPAGAVGLWQFMPATGEVYGLQQNRHLDQRKNPRLATQAAAHHLRDLYMRFGNWELALAAYNMGYEQLLDRIDAYGTSDFNELARQEALPTETASYVPKIAAAAIVANNLDRFGFDDVKVSQPNDSAEIAVPPGTPLKTLAKAAGVATSVLRRLNPDLLGDKVPPGRGDFLVMVPSDTLSRAQASLPALLDREPLSDDASVLNPIDLLGGRDFDQRRAQRDDESLLSLLPSPKKRRSMRDPVASLVPVDEPEQADEPEEEPLVRPRRARKGGRQPLLYRVGPGDTLIGVARQFAVDVEDVARDNGLEADTKLRVGALLRLRVRPEMMEAGAGDADPEAAPKGRSEGEGPARGERSSAETPGAPRAASERAGAGPKDPGKSDAGSRQPAGARAAPPKARRKLGGRG